jgi:hypothetical protein
MEDADMFYCHLVYFTDIWYTYFIHLVYILCGNLGYFSRFSVLYKEKSGNPVTER